MSAFFLCSTTRDNIHDLGGMSLQLASSSGGDSISLQVTLKRASERRFASDASGELLHGHLRDCRLVLIFSTLIAMNGGQGRKVFHADQSLHLEKGFQVLLGGVPSLEGIRIKTDGSVRDRSFISRVLLLLQKHRVTDSPCHFSQSCSPRLMSFFFSVLPLLLDDLNTRMLD